MGKKFNMTNGARVLMPDEAKMILPTYDRIIDQIEGIRKDSWNPDEAIATQDQKLNNIGILGARGTGKTSILKTLISDLEKKNREYEDYDNINIVLPTIVPEAMSESNNIMSIVLGLFKPIVDDLHKKFNYGKRERWEIEKLPIEEKYDELVKKFCFIQPEYKKISVNQYTSDNDYIRKTADIYQSDIAFLPALHKFIKLLLKTDFETGRASNSDELSYSKRLIFIVIDDIDLSTQYSVDIVKTLLAYISHPRIVSIISGDLETFEETLTLDFIRKEKALSGDIMNASFVNSNGETAFLDRKKTLSYEYLKKILPPQYRHSVRHWSLGNRGDYHLDVNGNGRPDDAEKMSSLLKQCFSVFLEPPIFKYYNVYRDNDGSLTKVANNLPHSYHIFDDTARGLNNTYNALLDMSEVIENINKKLNRKKYVEIAEELARDQVVLSEDLQEYYEKNCKDIKNFEEKIFQHAKIFIETIVVSNAQFNAYRVELLEKVIRFGDSFYSTHINWNSFRNLISEEENFDFFSSKSETSHELLRKKLRNFRLFVFLDFAIRLMRKTSLLESDIYLELKRSVTADLINIPLISEGDDKNEWLVNYNPKNKKISVISRDSSDELFSENESAYDLNDILVNLFSNFDFRQIFILHQYLSSNSYNIFDENINSKMFSLYRFMKSIELLFDEDGLFRIMEVNKKEFNIIYGMLYKIEQADIAQEIAKQVFLKPNIPFKRYQIYYDKTMEEIVLGKLFKSNSYSKFNTNDYKELLTEDSSIVEQIKVIEAILNKNSNNREKVKEHQCYQQIINSVKFKINKEFILSTKVSIALDFDIESLLKNSRDEYIFQKNIVDEINQILERKYKNISLMSAKKIFEEWRDFSERMVNKRKLLEDQSEKNTGSSGINSNQHQTKWENLINQIERIVKDLPHNIEFICDRNLKLIMWLHIYFELEYADKIKRENLDVSEFKKLIKDYLKDSKKKSKNDFKTFQSMFSNKDVKSLDSDRFNELFSDKN